MRMDDDKWIDDVLGMDPDSAKDQALEWVARLVTGQADAALLAEFEQWRDSDPRNEKALAEARRLWLLIGAPLEAQYAPVLASQAVQRRPARTLLRRGPWLAMAAGVVLAVGLATHWLLDGRYDQATGVGEQRTVALSDGSTMWLNTASAADIRVNGQERHVRLARGEAYFDVARMPDRPFTVDAGEGRIVVLGTAFGVRREGSDVVVTVQRGRVQVSGSGTAPVVLVHDQEVRVRPGDRRGQVVRVNAEQALAWRTGHLQFENRPIGEVLKELKRYDRRLVIVAYPDADRLRVTSIVDLARIDEWYGVLGQSLPVQVTQIGPLVWIRPSPAAAS